MHLLTFHSCLQYHFLSKMSTTSVFLFPIYPSLPILPPPPFSLLVSSIPKTSRKPYTLLSLSKPRILIPTHSATAIADHHSSTPPSTPTTTSTIAVDNELSDESTVFEIRACNRIGLLSVITKVFRLLGLRVDHATVEFEGEFFVKRFFVVDSDGRKIEREEDLAPIEKAIREAIEEKGGEKRVGAAMLGAKGVVTRKAGLGLRIGERKAKVKAERMFELMNGFLKNDSVSLQKDILHHVEYTVAARSKFSFDDFEAYQVRFLGFLSK